MNFRWLALPLAALSLWSCDERVADSNQRGTNDETSTFFLPDGRKAANATVTVFAAGKTDTLPALKTWASSDGSVNLPKLDRGYYSMVVRDESGHATFIDSVFSNGTSTIVPNDTLRLTGTVTGRISLQSQHDPRMGWVALPGAGIFANVDDSGRFTLKGIPEGRFNLVARTDIADYTSTFRLVVVKGDSVSDVGTIEVVYTGLPIVTGIVGIWDSLAGAVVLHWDETTSPKVKGYRVYRGTSTDPSKETFLQFVTLGQNSLTDTVFQNNYWEINRIYADTSYIRYRVTTVGQDDNEGSRWNSWSDTLRSPMFVAQLAATWTLVSNNAPQGNYRLDTLSGALVAIETDDGYSHVFAKTSSDGGKSWNLRRSDSIINSNGALIPGLHESITSGGRLWWVRAVPSGRQVAPTPSSLYPSSMYDLADSLRIYSMDATGAIDSSSIATSDDSVYSAILVADADGPVLLEGITRIAVGTSEPYLFVTHRRLRTSDGKWQVGAWATWYPDDPSQDIRYMMLQPRPRRIVSIGGEQSFHRAGTIDFDMDSRLLSTALGLSYALPESPEKRHKVIGSPSSSTSIAYWRGSILVAEPGKLWSVTFP